MTRRCSTGLRVRRLAAIVGAVGVAVLASACGETPQTAFNPRSEYATEGLDLFVLIIWMGVIQMKFVWPGKASRLPPSAGIQNE